MKGCKERIEIMTNSEKPETVQEIPVIDEVSVSDKSITNEAIREISLVPKWIYYAAFFITFTIPNLVFSGRSWFDTLHIMKWFVTMVPVAVIAAIAGFNLFRHGASRVNFKMDQFGIAWIAIILLITLQPFFIQMTSTATFVKELFFFATLFAVYVLCCNQKPDGRFFRLLLWGCSINASLNILFAEIMIRGISPEIMIYGISVKFPFIMDVPGNYIGNTGQQEMFGLWVAMAILNCMYLHVHYSEKWRSEKTSVCMMILNIFFMSVNACGLWRTTARGGILALFVGFAIMILCFARNKAWKAVVHLASLIGVVLLFFALFIVINPFGGPNRGAATVHKITDMVVNTGTFGGRIAIWRVSNEIFLKHPVAGVGLGHYKWHFLDGQSTLFEKYPELIDNPDYPWQYTYWAHNEFLQWLCETGIIGALLLGLMSLYWLISLIRTLASGRKIQPESVWGVSMLFLLFFNALFSRPFHRIENAVWMSLAFALANRCILSEIAALSKRESEFVYRCFGAFIASVAVCGLFFLDGGIMGDKLLYRALHPISVESKRENISRAALYLMSREDAEEQMANLNLSIGLENLDEDTYIQGVNELLMVFKRRPNSERLFKLYDCARELDSAELVMHILPYLPPGSVTIN